MRLISQRFRLELRAIAFSKEGTKGPDLLECTTFPNAGDIGVSVRGPKLTPRGAIFADRTYRERAFERALLFKFRPDMISRMIIVLLSLVMLVPALAQQIEVATKVMSQTEGPTVDREGNVYFTEASKRS